MQLFSTQFGLPVYSLLLTGANVPRASFQPLPLESLQPGQNVSAPGSYIQWHRDSAEEKQWGQPLILDIISSIFFFKNNGGREK